MNELLKEKIGVELLKAKKLGKESLHPLEICDILEENINEIIETCHEYFETTVKKIDGKIYPSFKIPLGEKKIYELPERKEIIENLKKLVS